MITGRCGLCGLLCELLGLLCELLGLLWELLGLLCGYRLEGWSPASW